MKIRYGILLLLVLMGCATSPTGRSQLVAIPDEKMNTLGGAAFHEVKQKTPIEHDTQINVYVKCIASNVVADCADRTGVKNWEIVVFKDKSANAFALPGGKIGVNTGLLAVAENADQLAAVIGHEVGHVVARHGAERMSQAMAAQGVLILADVFMDRESPYHNVTMGALGLGAQVGVLYSFSRIHESEADEIGQELMARAGFDPRQSMDLWKNMAKNSKGHPPEWLSTHPANDTRIQALRDHLPASLRIYKQAEAQGRRPNCGSPQGQ